jgi:hypothetical protein
MTAQKMTAQKMTTARSRPPRRNRAEPDGKPPAEHALSRLCPASQRARALFSRNCLPREPSRLRGRILSSRGLVGRSAVNFSM